MPSTGAIADLVRVGADFHARGWVLGTSGNLSTVVAREPLRLAITASTVDKGRLCAADIVEVDGDGRKVGGGEGKPSAETRLHVAIVRATGVGAVLHTHSVWSTVLSDFHAADRGLFIEGYEMLKGLEGISTHEHREWLPILENSQDMELLGARVRAMIEESPHAHGFLLRRHGLYAWGGDLRTAARHVEILEFLLESVGRRRTMEPQRQGG